MYERYRLHSWMTDTSRVSADVLKVLQAINQTPKNFRDFESRVQPVVSIRDWMTQYMVRFVIHFVLPYFDSFLECMPQISTLLIRITIFINTP